MAHTHAFASRLSWRGSTAVGYGANERTHRVVVPPAEGELVMSSAPAFNGDSRLPDPEQLLLAAASSCQLLTFLAMAARSRIDVLAYDDAAEAVMPEVERPMRITRITLRPKIVVTEGADLDRVRRLVAKSHDHCFIANTLTAESTSTRPSSSPRPTPTSAPDDRTRRETPVGHHDKERTVMKDLAIVLDDRPGALADMGAALGRPA